MIKIPALRGGGGFFYFSREGLKVIRCPICGQDFALEDEPCDKRIWGKTVADCLKEEEDDE